MARLLIASFSRLVSDARLRRQIKAFSDEYEVVTLGYGPKPEGVSQHVQIPDEAKNVIYGRYITLRSYRLALWTMDGIRVASKALKDLDFDVALANDMYMLPVVARASTGSGWHADMHEYFPRLKEDDPKWKARIGPFYSWIIRTYAKSANSMTTVSEGLALEYEREFGFHADIVTNATDFHDFEPRHVDRPIRAVHSGAGLTGRMIEVMIEGFRDIPPEEMTFDLFLTRNHPDYLVQLEQLSREIPAVTVREPVPYDDLHVLLNSYDVGIHLLQPTNFNHAHALPNKIFDFIQARLGLVIGPSKEMSKVVEAYELGVVINDFTAQSLNRKLKEMTSDDVMRWKANSHEHARALSGNEGEEIWKAKIAAILGRDQ